MLINNKNKRYPNIFVSQKYGLISFDNFYYILHMNFSNKLYVFININTIYYLKNNWDDCFINNRYIEP